jgi:hypothetical protein
MFGKIGSSFEVIERKENMHVVDHFLATHWTRFTVEMLCSYKEITSAHWSVAVLFTFFAF